MVIVVDSSDLQPDQLRLRTMALVASRWQGEEHPRSISWVYAARGPIAAADFHIGDSGADLESLGTVYRLAEPI